MRLSHVSARVAAPLLLVAAWLGTTQAQPPAPSDPKGPAPSYEESPPGVLAPQPAVEASGCDGCGRCHGCARGGACGDRGRCAPCGRCDGHCHDRLRRLYDRITDPHDGCYCPTPYGATVNAILDVQKSKGKAAQMVLYHYDFEPDGANLTCRGTIQVHKLGQMMMEHPHPLVIEPADCNAELDAARRSAVLAALHQLNIPVAEERVVVAAPPSAGLRGDQAHEVHQQSLQLWRQGIFLPKGSVPSTTGGVIGTGVGGLTGSGMAPY